MADRKRLLGPDDPPPFTAVPAQNDSPFLLIADHAGQTVPAALGRLGLPQAELDRHIGWDIGIAAVTCKLAERLGACAVLQNYSRLVIDCNRPLPSPGSIVDSSDHTPVPGNVGLGTEQRHQRVEEIFVPYHARIATEIDARLQAGQPPVLVAMHSFTPQMDGVQRPWHAGVLYLSDTRLAHPLLRALRAESGLVIGDNQPYAAGNATDYALPLHGQSRGLLHVELEIRQDLIADPAGQDAWAERLARMLPACLQAATGT